MAQKDDVIVAMEKNGGYATFQQLNNMVDVSTWKTKTPAESIRRIVQVYEEFFKIKPGLWALTKDKDEVLRKLGIKPNNKKSDEVFTHAYYQGIVVKLGNNKKYMTYVPAQDKNKKFLETKLCDLTTVETIPQFTYSNLIRRAKMVDVIWFNERRMPCSFYEIEHTTDIKNSLGKFYELQDFRANFFIVADESRREQFLDTISASMYNPIRDYVKFKSYDSIIKQYNKEQIIIEDEL
ncbi:MAG: hypothetical protein GX284_00210 [Clostridiales bacterium]|nr:hypothetical protein [Clostridiales bacterium]